MKIYICSSSGSKELQILQNMKMLSIIFEDKNYEYTFDYINIMIYDNGNNCY